MNKTNPTKDELIARVKKAIEFLKFHNVRDAKSEFFDNVYGAMYKAESNRLDNLWARKTTDLEFTELLEEFAQNPTSIVKHTAEFKRFMKFVDWYTKLGGRQLTIKEIEDMYPNF